jgi:hypothetical protein
MRASIELVLVAALGVAACEQSATKVAMTGMAITTESGIVHAPLTPPRPFQESDAHLPLDFKAPLVFIVHVTARMRRGIDPQGLNESRR